MRFKHLLKKRNIIIIIIVSALLAWGLMHSCSQEIVQKKLYTIGRDNTWYPYHLRGKDKNLVAFTNDLMAAISQETKLNFEWTITNHSTLVEGLNDENYDAIISTMRPNPVNQNQYLFSDLLFELGLVLVVHQNSSITSLKDLQGKTLGISRSSYFIFNSIKERRTNAQNIRLITYNHVNQALESLANGNLDGIITHAVSAYALTKSFNKKNFKVVTAPLTDEGLRLITLKNSANESFLNDVNLALKKLKENGVYSELISKWSLNDPSANFNQEAN